MRFRLNSNYSFSVILKQYHSELFMNAIGIWVLS